MCSMRSWSCEQLVVGEMITAASVQRWWSLVAGLNVVLSGHPEALAWWPLTPSMRMLWTVFHLVFKESWICLLPVFCNVGSLSPHQCSYPLWCCTWCLWWVSAHWLAVLSELCCFGWSLFPSQHSRSIVFVAGKSCCCVWYVGGGNDRRMLLPSALTFHLHVPFIIFLSDQFS